jgi:hypothetical protein
MEDDCAICLKALADRYQEDVAASAELRAMPCSYVFHKHCIFEWLRRNNTCPICHYQLRSMDDDNDVEEA